MSLRFTVLGFLDMAPMTGYQVKRSMDSSTRFFWQAELSQIYPTLKQLEAEALVVATIEPQSGKPDKKIYTITPAGRDALTAWLMEPIAELPMTKDPLLLKLFFAGALDTSTILHQLRLQLDLHRARWRQYTEETAAAIAEQVAVTGLTRHGVLWELVRRRGERHEHAYIEWLEEAIATVEARL